MLEAEAAFVDTLDDLMDTVENGIKSVLRGVLTSQGKRAEKTKNDLVVIEKALMEDERESEHSSRSTNGLPSTAPSRLSTLERLIDQPFHRITYTKAIDLLSSQHKTTPFQFSPSWGLSLQSEHEKFLASPRCLDGPVFVTDYPRDLKPFYMRLNDNDQTSEVTTDAVPCSTRETVACFDLLVPDMGELAGGSLREERLSLLSSRMDAIGMDKADYEWYLDLRRYGTVRHGGWGMGFDRFVCWITGVGNIRDVVAFPRWKGHCQY